MNKKERIRELEKRIAQLEGRVIQLDARPTWYWCLWWQPYCPGWQVPQITWGDSDTLSVTNTDWDNGWVDANGNKWQTTGAHG